MAKKGKKKKEPPPPPKPESEVELLPGKDGGAETVVLHTGTIARMGRWTVTEAKQNFVVVLHDAGTAVMLPAAYAGVVFARERPSPEVVTLQRKLAEAEKAKEDKKGAQATFDEMKALDADIKALQTDLAAQPEGVKLTSDGQRTEGPDGLPTAAECSDAVAGAPPPPPSPGWFKIADYLLRLSYPTAPLDPDAPSVLRSIEKTGVIEIVPLTGLATGSPFQLTLSAGGGCVATVQTEGDPHVLAPVPPVDLRNLVPLPDIGGGTWQLRALARFQGFELLRSMLCAKVSERVMLAVRETLAQEAAAVDNQWVMRRSLIHLLVTMEAPQEVVRSVVAIGGAAVVETPPLVRYVRELRSPCVCSEWCIATVRDGVEPVHNRRNNLVFYHEGSGLYVALPPVSAGEFFMHSQAQARESNDSFIHGGFAVSHATAIDAEGVQAPADSAATMLFCRFRKTVCRDKLPVGRFVRCWKTAHPQARVATPY